MAVIIDDTHDNLTDGLEIVERGGYPQEVKKRIVVKSLTKGTTQETILAALAKQHVPKDGDPLVKATHNDVRVWRRTARILTVDPANGKALVEIDVFYKWMPGTKSDQGTSKGRVISGGSGTETVRTTTDKDGADLMVTLGSAAGVGGKEQILEANKLVPTTSLSVEIYSALKPQAFQSIYVGKLNHEAWQGGAAKTWLCSGAEFRRETNIDDETIGGFHRYVFNMHYKAATWKWSGIFYDPETGLIPNTQDQYSEKDFEIYDTADFTGLLNAI